MMMISYCFLLYLPQVAFSSLFEAPMGPYWLTITGLDKCSNEGSKEIAFDLHLKKINRKTTAMYGNFILKRPIDRKLKMKIEVSVWGNGGWRANAYNLVLDRNACKIFYDSFSEVFDNLSAAVGYNNTDPCNIPPKNYQLKEFVVTNWSLKTVPVMLYGKYRATITYYAEDVPLLGCWRVIFEVIRRG